MKQIHTQYTELLEKKKKTLREASPRLKRKAKPQGDLKFSMALPVVFTKTKGGSEKEK